MTDKIIKEENIKELFEGMELSEEFKTKAETLIEAVVAERIASIHEKLEEEFKTKLEEKEYELVEKIDEYMNYITEEFMKENEIAIETGIKAELAESFMSGIKELFENHYIEISEEKEDVLKSLAEDNEDLERKLNEVLRKNIEMTEEIEKIKKEKIFNEMVNGLTDTDKERLEKIAENIAHNSIEDYENKLKVIVEDYLSNTKRRSNVEYQLTEEIETSEKIINENDPMSLYLKYSKIVNS